MKATYCIVLALLIATSCGDSHGRGDPTDASTRTDVTFQADVGTNDTALRDTAMRPDTNFPSDGSLATCTADYPESAFIPDRLAAVLTTTIGRSIIRHRLIGEEPSPQPTPNPGVPMFIDPNDRNCGNENGVGFAWDGQRCRAVRESYCRSQGCPEIHTLESDCRSAHAACEPELCRNTQGVWSEVPVTCGPWTCGIPAGLWGTSECDGPPRAQCACPIGLTFTDFGCLRSRSQCPLSNEEQGCIEGNGTWHREASNCGNWSCGTRPICEAVIPGCDCGPLRTFNPSSNRCEASQLCTGNSSRVDELCRWSGGTWVENTCGHFQCGRPSQLACVSGGCNCGAQGIFDNDQGCVLAPLCRTNACF